MCADTASDANMAEHSFSWQYITDSFIESPETLKSDLIKLVSDKKDDSTIDDFFYEILVSIFDYPTRVSNILLSQLLNEILAQFPTDKRSSLSENFIILSQSFPTNNTNLNNFLKDCLIDKKYKILYFDKLVLKNYGIFTDFSRYYYNDAKNRIYSVETFSSLHESSEGYAKYISFLLNFIDNQKIVSEIPFLINVLDEIIITFSLDINRCFLLLLTILSSFLGTDESFVLEIIKQTRWFRSHEYNNSIQSTVIDFLLNYTDVDIYELKLITLLIKHNLLEFHSIYNVLGPLDINIKNLTEVELIEDIENNDPIDKLYEEIKNDLKEKSNQSNSSALALAAPLLPDSDDENDNNMNNIHEKKSNNNDIKDKDTTSEKNDVSIQEKIKLYRKINFLQYLIEYEMFEELSLVLVHHPKIPLISNDVADQLNNFIDNQISPFYYKYCDSLNISSNDHILSNNSNIENIDDFLNFINKTIPFNKFKITRNSQMLTKIIRIIRNSLEREIKDKDFWLQFFRITIFPYLSFSQNIPLINESFEILNNFYTLSDRYNLYGEYQMVTIKNDLDLEINFNKFEKETKNLLKRLSIENLNSSCRSLNKLCSINPLSTSLTFISHLESYSSLINLICESSKFFNDYSWDVITFQLLNKLFSNKLKIQNDGINYNSWFINLSQFIGESSNLYPESFQLLPILECLIKSLKIQDFDVLVVIKELLNLMTGIKSINNLTVKQIMLINGETSLQKLALSTIQDKRFKCIKSTKKLLNLLIDNNLLNNLIILLSQIPNKLTGSDDDEDNKSNDKPLKFVTLKIDEVTNLIHQLITSIDLNLNHEKFKEKVVSIEGFLDDYKMQPQWVFEIWRRNLSRMFKNNDNKIDEELVVKLEKSSFLSSFSIKINFNFYLIFWQLSLYDISFPDISYNKEYSDLKSQITGISLKLKHRNELSKKDYNELLDKRDEQISILNNIRRDMKIHENNHKLIIQRLNDNKQLWFNDIKEEEEISVIKSIIQHCLLPRLQHSSFDAVFVAKFIFFINKIETPGYKLYELLDNLFSIKFLKNVLFTNTEIETENLSLFFKIVIIKLDEWRNSESIYEKESLKFNKDLSYDQFKEVLYKWNCKLLEQLIESLDSEEYTTRNNSIIFVKIILENFPIIEEQADELLNKLEDILKKDEREDIKLSTRALIGLVTYQKPKFISVWNYYNMNNELKEIAMKAKGEKLKLEKQKENELKLKQIEDDKREREKLKAEQLLKQTKKPISYGLVGLSNKAVNKVNEEKEEEIKKAEVPEKDAKDVKEPEKKETLEIPGLTTLKTDNLTSSIPKAPASSVSSNNTDTVKNKLPKAPNASNSSKTSKESTSESKTKTPTKSAVATSKGPFKSTSSNSNIPNRPSTTTATASSAPLSKSNSKNASMNRNNNNSKGTDIIPSSRNNRYSNSNDRQSKEDTYNNNNSKNRYYDNRYYSNESKNSYNNYDRDRDLHRNNSSSKNSKGGNGDRYNYRGASNRMASSAAAPLPPPSNPPPPPTGPASATTSTSASASGSKNNNKNNNHNHNKNGKRSYGSDNDYYGGQGHSYYNNNNNNNKRRK